MAAGRRTGRDARGSTLLELAVALSLVTLVLAGVLAVWTGAQQAYLVGAGAAELQQTLRAVLDLMAREIRAAGRDVTLCAFDFAAVEPGAVGDCGTSRREACRCRLNGGSPPCPASPYDSCASEFAIPWAEVRATGLRVRSDRNGDGRIDPTGEEDVRYGWVSGSPPCPPGVARCLTRDAGSGATALTAVDIVHFRLTYFPRPGVGPCAALADPCPPLALPLTSQREADGIGRIRIEVTGVDALGGGPVARTLVTDVALRNRS
jgi:hypothetical protein